MAASMIFSLVLPAVLFTHRTAASPTPIRNCTRSGRQIPVGETVQDSFGEKECYINPNGHLDFRYVTCVKNGQTLLNGQEMRIYRHYYYRCNLTRVPASLHLVACVSPLGNRIDLDSEARDGRFVIACLSLKTNGSNLYQRKPVACISPSGERIEPGEKVLVKRPGKGAGRWMLCKLHSKGGLTFQSAGCQRNGTMIANGTEWLSNNNFWRRCIESPEGRAKTSNIACGDGKGGRFPPGQLFLNPTRRYWRRCESNETFFGHIPVGCNNRDGDLLIEPGQTWKEGDYLKKCFEENGTIRWNYLEITVAPISTQITIEPRLNDTLSILSPLDISNDTLST